ncbi:MAG: ATP-binding protein [Oscillospiraceae bacterium]|nr:ATP-binding protein [Oscillospiraceae bacterium]
MPFEAKVIHAATQRLRQRREDNQQEYARRRSEVYQRLPRIQTIDHQLRKTVTLAATTALKKGADPAQAIAAIRDANLALQQERAQLLQRNGYSPDYLLEKPVCPLCKDSGWVGARMCDCLKSLCTEEQNLLLSSMLDLKDQSFENFRLDYYSPTDQAIMGMVLNICRNFAVEFGTYAYQNLMLFGPPGVGKTFLSAAIARVVSERGFSVVYDTAIQIFSQFEMEKFTHDPESIKSTQRYLSCDLLILDDLGSEFLSPMVQTTLYHLINARLVSNRCTVISTNLTLTDIDTRYSRQSASRLKGEYQLLRCVGPDIRQKKRR